ncbi:MAG: hypothetical protein S4CHLAM45_13540 [Chlamydiales bacterium]|nr:hypothetical protein [Chlamydiales bacterium]MCH9620458.1 hypothetical protein [Chlamydiales bacterium]MCH9623444.1 hypothetical protein [Chlamydiales bacterium]
MLGCQTVKEGIYFISGAGIAWGTVSLAFHAGSPDCKGENDPCMYYHLPIWFPVAVTCISLAGLAFTWREYQRPPRPEGNVEHV